MAKQAFRAGDAVEVLDGAHKGEVWVVAVYDADEDTAYIAGWPPGRVCDATGFLSLKRAATDGQHAEMIEGVRGIRTDHGERDFRTMALERVLARGGTP